jgi:hypothetical protein
MNFRASMNGAFPAQETIQLHYRVPYYSTCTPTWTSFIKPKALHLIAVDTVAVDNPRNVWVRLQAGGRNTSLVHGVQNSPNLWHSPNLEPRGHRDFVTRSKTADAEAHGGTKNVWSWTCTSNQVWYLPVTKNRGKRTLIWDAFKYYPHPPCTLVTSCRVSITNVKTLFGWS